MQKKLSPKHVRIYFLGNSVTITRYGVERCYLNVPWKRMQWIGSICNADFKAGLSTQSGHVLGRGPWLYLPNTRLQADAACTCENPNVAPYHHCRCIRCGLPIRSAAKA
jgi:hypothetical protein